MRLASRLVLLVGLPLALSGCVSGGVGSPSLAPASSTVTALNGGLVGQQPAMGLTELAQRQALEAEYQALQFGRVGQPVPWQAGPFSGEVVPTQLYRVGSQDCRGYTHTVVQGGQSIRRVGTACREGNLWSIV